MRPTFERNHIKVFFATAPSPPVTEKLEEAFLLVSSCGLLNVNIRQKKNSSIPTWCGPRGFSQTRIHNRVVHISMATQTREGCLT